MIVRRRFKNNRTKVPYYYLLGTKVQRRYVLYEWKVDYLVTSTEGKTLQSVNKDTCVGGGRSNGCQAKAPGPSNYSRYIARPAQRRIATT